MKIGIENVRDEKIRQIVNLLMREIRASLPHITSAVLFGSVGRGEIKKVVDLDIIFVSDRIEKYSKESSQLLNCFLSLKGSEEYKEVKKEGYYILFSPIVYTKLDLMHTPPLLLDVVEDGIVLFDDGFMIKRIEWLQRRLNELGAIRKKTEKGWYWVLKPDIKFGEVVEL